MPYAYIDDIAVSDIAFHAWGAILEDTFRAAAEATVRAVMTPNPICVTEDAPLESAMEYIKFHRIRRLIVLNKALEVGGFLPSMISLSSWRRSVRRSTPGPGSCVSCATSGCSLHSPQQQDASQLWHATQQAAVAAADAPELRSYLQPP